MGPFEVVSDRDERIVINKDNSVLPLLPATRDFREPSIVNAVGEPRMRVALIKSSFNIEGLRDKVPECQAAFAPSETPP
jgi:hypothetical protein